MTSTIKMTAQAKASYQAIGSVYSPAIKDNVLFNNYGWRHLRYNGAGKKRLPPDLRRRLHLFAHVVTVVKGCKTIVETEERSIYLNGLLRTATYVEISHECTDNKGTRTITVVLRKFEIGPYHFYSVR